MCFKFLHVVFLQSSRETRYSKEFYESLEHLLQLFVPQILRRLKEDAHVAKVVTAYENSH